MLAPCVWRKDLSSREVHIVRLTSTVNLTLNGFRRERVSVCLVSGWRVDDRVSSGNSI